MKTDDLIAELKTLNETEMLLVLSAIQYHIKRCTHYPQLMEDILKASEDWEKAWLSTLK